MKKVLTAFFLCAMLFAVFAVPSQAQAKALTWTTHYNELTINGYDAYADGLNGKGASGVGWRISNTDTDSLQIYLDNYKGGPIVIGTGDNESNIVRTVYFYIDNSCTVHGTSSMPSIWFKGGTNSEIPIQISFSLYGNAQLNLIDGPIGIYRDGLIYDSDSHTWMKFTGYNTTGALPQVYISGNTMGINPIGDLDFKKNIAAYIDSNNIGIGGTTSKGNTVNVYDSSSLYVHGESKAMNFSPKTIATGLQTYNTYSSKYYAIHPAITADYLKSYVKLTNFSPASNSSGMMDISMKTNETKTFRFSYTAPKWMNSYFGFDFRPYFEDSGTELPDGNGLTDGTAYSYSKTKPGTYYLRDAISMFYNKIFVADLYRDYRITVKNADTNPDTSCHGDKTKCPSAKFKDAPKYGTWSHDGIDFCLNRGLFSGTSETTFGPQMNMSRAMLVTVLWRYSNSPTGYSNTFKDVNAKTGSWYVDAVAWAAANNIVSGVGDNKFDPDGTITREQMAAILFRYANFRGFNTAKRDSLSSFPDAGKVNPWAKTGVQWAVAEGLITGANTGGKTYLMPQGGATREQVASILMRFIQNIAEKK